MINLANRKIHIIRIEKNLVEIWLVFQDRFAGSLVGTGTKSYSVVLGSFMSVQLMHTLWTCHILRKSSRQRNP